MEMVSPAGPVYQAGTLSGNPLSMASGIATLELLREDSTYEKLEAASARLADGLLGAARDAGVPLVVNRVGSMLNPFFVHENGASVTNFAEATACDTGRFAKFFQAMLDRGVFLPPSQFEAWFVGTAHDDEAITTTLEAAAEAFATLT
jgi:glutamate-1-semialdehyde 2,1-aminomutase